MTDSDSRAHTSPPGSSTADGVTSSEPSDGATPGDDVVVVLSYFGCADTLACVESVVTGSPEARVLVIDNGSYDGVLEAVASRWPGIATLQTGTNLGFSGGMNQGLLWALRSGAGTITVLNNDTVVSPGAIAALSRIARTGAVVSPEVRYADGSERVWFGGGTIDAATHLPRHLTAAEIEAADGAVVPALRSSRVLAGCCVTATADAWSTVGPFDDRYFLNFEDSDWSLRATDLGIPLVVATSTVIHHRVSASFTGAYSYLGLYYYARNGLLFGSTFAPRSHAQRWRFLRRHVLPVLGQDVRSRRIRDAARHALLITSAIGAHAVGRYGRAARWLEHRATRWRQDDDRREAPGNTDGGDTGDLPG